MTAKPLVVGDVLVLLRGEENPWEVFRVNRLLGSDVELVMLPRFGTASSLVLPSAEVVRWSVPCSSISEAERVYAQMMDVAVEKARTAAEQKVSRSAAKQAALEREPLAIGDLVRIVGGDSQGMVGRVAGLQGTDVEVRCRDEGRESRLTVPAISVRRWELLAEAREMESGKASYRAGTIEMNELALIEAATETDKTKLADTLRWMYEAQSKCNSSDEKPVKK